MRLFGATLALLAVGCAQHKSAEYAYEERGGYGGAMPSSVPMAEAAYPEMDDAGFPPPAPPPPPPSTVAPSDTAPESPPQPNGPGTEVQQQQRMIHYEGWAQLRVADPSETLDAVVGLAEAVGGRTERLSGTSVVVRVPVATFEQVYADVLALGDVMNKSVRADDVTDAFRAVDLRANTLRATHTRLIELLAKATDEQEKLRLLQEITRVTEQLDTIESQLRTLAELADLSRISVDAVAREAFSTAGNRPVLAGFEWIAALSPVNRAPWTDDHRVALPVPDGLVSLSNQGPFAAESADGTVLWTMRVDNDPVGDGDFWMDAVEGRVGPEFDAPTRKAVGRWSCLVVDEPGADAPYRWQVCAAVDGKHVEVAQAFFPGAEQVERYSAAVDAALGQGGAS